MHHARTRGRRLAAAAVTVVLAATGGTLTALPATAAAPAATQQEQQTTTVPFPRDADVVGAGPSGFLSKTRGSTPEYRWTWYADGSSVVMPGASAAGGGSDLVVTGDRTVLTVSSVLRIHDMTRPGAAPLEIDLDALGDYAYSGLAGDTLLLGRYEGGVVVQYGVTLDAATLAGGTPKLRKLVGGPQIDCRDADGGWTDTTAVLYDCWISETIPVKISVDLATGTDLWYMSGYERVAFDGAVSATHVAWREGGAEDGIAAVRRGGSEPYRWFPDAEADVRDPLYLVGSWMAYGQRAHIDAPADGPAANPAVRPFTVRSIDTGEKAVLLTAFSSAVAGPGGSLLVRGGTPEHGEGLYRIAPRADGGRPTVELVASTGQTTVVTLTGATTPQALSGDQLARGVDFSWDLSRGDAHVKVRLKHVRSGQSITQEWPADQIDGAPRRVSWRWDGKDLERPNGLLGPARAGEYEWELVAVPEEGIGPRLATTGRFTVTRPAAPHDFDGDGSADLFTRVPGGDLWSYRSQPVAVGGSIRHAGRTRIGAGWQVYDRVETAGNIVGSSAPDVLARDRSGALWLHRGTGDRGTPFAGRTLVSAGWQVYDRIAAGSDVTGDGRPDLVATDKAGVLWLHPGTGNATTPFSARKRLGGGWGVYNEVVAVGNITGGPAGDLLARDRAGVLWSHLGKGDGTFAPRTRVGGGWGGFTDLVGVGDANGDGRADLIASAGGATFYAGTGDWKAPLKAGLRTDVTNGVPYDAAF
ncbi:N-acetylmuramoyl-L-alanine amidase [Streptomyces sp. NPDC012693]|uniref:N-acetylmuramoyl-L-alanine amidase n=1 Tax=Streptomyces sp. NPDC012693 TaxID=3364844 RepID=UPI0036C23E3F